VCVCVITVKNNVFLVFCYGMDMRRNHLFD
jgi:hypothetical protein